MTKKLVQSTQLNGLSVEERTRYSRHLLLDGFGVEGQMRLKNARVLIVGAGGLGCPVGMYLAGAGVGTIAVVDFDLIDLSNIHRQVAYKTADQNHSKAETLIDTMCGINPNLQYKAYNQRITQENVTSLIKEYDLIIDGTDNFETRFLVADACYFAKVPLLHGAVHQYSAQIALFTFSDLPCFRCLYPQPPVSDGLAACNVAGILGPMAGIVGTIMALEAVKYLANLSSKSPDLQLLQTSNTQLSTSIIKYNALEQTMEHLSLRKDPHCPLCGTTPVIQAIQAVQASATTCTMPSFQRNGEIMDEKELGIITPAVARKLLAEEAMLIDVREPFEYARGHIENSLSMPLLDLKMELSTKGITKDKTLVVYCQKGIRSLAAVTFLRQAGYKNSYTIAGGIEEW